MLRASKRAAISFIWPQVGPVFRPSAKRLDTSVLFQDHSGAPTSNHTQFIHAATAGRPESEEVARFLDATPGLKYKVALRAYGAGLRVSEVVALKVSDIDSKRMVIRIEQGKGHRTAT
jgi:integrase